jgi:hypothetical protein
LNKAFASRRSRRPPPSSSCRFKLRRKHHERNQTCHRLADRGRYPGHPAGDRRREAGGSQRPAQSGQGRQHQRIPAQQGAGGPTGNAAENAANTPENASGNATEDSAKGAEKERSVQPESTDEQP